MLLALVALVAVAALSTLGALLATALLVVPAATTRLVCSRLRPWQLATVALVAVEGVAGLWLSVELDAPPGPAIAVLAGGVFAAVAAGRVLGRAPSCRRRGRRPPRSRCWRRVRTDPAWRRTRQAKVVATTTQIGDFARAVGGERAKVVQLLQPNTDPHEYEPRPADVRETADADVVLLSGDDLDRWMGDVVEAAGGRAGDRRPRRARSGQGGGGEQGPEASRYDPHWWHDPRNAQAAVAAIRDALTRANPGARDVYARNAAAYLARLRSSIAGSPRAWGASRPPRASSSPITTPSATSPAATRITVVGAVIPSQSTQAQPSAGDVARLTRTHPPRGREGGLPRELDQPQARPGHRAPDRGDERHELYGDTLGPKGSRGATYLAMSAPTPTRWCAASPGEHGVPDRGDLTLVRAEGLAAGYGAAPVLTDVSFALHAGERIGVLGPNGGGKTTLFRVLLGELAPRGRHAAGARALRRRAADRALAAGLPGQRARRRADGRDLALPWWRRPGRAERRAARAALDAVGLGEQATRPSASSRAASASGC